MCIIKCVSSSPACDSVVIFPYSHITTGARWYHQVSPHPLKQHLFAVHRCTAGNPLRDLWLTVQHRWSQSIYCLIDRDRRVVPAIGFWSQSNCDRGKPYLIRSNNIFSKLQDWSVRIMLMQVFPCDANELLPIYNKTSLLKYKTARQVGDWSDPKYDPAGRESGSSSLGNKH